MTKQRHLGCRGLSIATWIQGGLAALAMGLTPAHPALGAEEPKPGQPSPAAEAKLFQGARQGDLELVKAAVAAGANVNCRDTNGLTPLLQTLHDVTAPIDANRRECVAFLLAHGARVDDVDNDKRTALIYATRAGDMETIRMLVQAGAFIKRRDRFYKMAVFYAAEAGRRDIVAYLGKTLKEKYHQSAW